MAAHVESAYFMDRYKPCEQSRRTQKKGSFDFGEQKMVEKGDLQQARGSVLAPFLL